jgi:endoglucanase Acf2
MKCAAGNTFNITYPMRGFLPFLPAPAKTGLKNDFDPDRMKQYLSMAADKTKYGDDTYWGAKNFLQMSQYMQMAEQRHDSADADKLRESLRTALVDWFTYTPGEKAHYFARYDKWKAMIGFKTSYGSEEFTDNHFHYGYFTKSAAALGFADPQFLVDYGGMAKRVAKQYANWDRDDKSFPFFRTMDLWAGHSWAGGMGSPGGNNQESSSEAVQSWAGLYLLGEAMNDPDMTAAGAMGYAMETSATLEYWFNIHGDTFPASYKHPIAGMIWSGGQVYGTWFSGDPAWIFGIQWLPWSPAFSYLNRDPVFAKKLFDEMVAERNRKEKKPNIDTAGSGLGNVLMTYLGQVDPDAAAAKMDEYWDTNNPIAKENDTGGMTYYWTHAARTLGPQQFEYHLSVPTSAVFYNDRTKKTTYVAYNPRSQAQTAVVFKNDQQVGTLKLPPNALTTTNTLQP